MTCVSKPKTHKGRKVLEARAPKIIENDKRTLVLKGVHTSEAVNNFLNDLVRFTYLTAPSFSVL